MSNNVNAPWISPAASPSQEHVMIMEEFHRPIVLVVPAGADILDAIIRFGRERDASIMVHHASGSISEVHLSRPVPPYNDLSFLGNNMHMFSLSGSYTNNLPLSSFNAQFLMETGTTPLPQQYGGRVKHRLIAAQPVHVMASLLDKDANHGASSSTGQSPASAAT